MMPMPATDSPSPRPPRASDLANPLMACALGFGTGLAPRAPGTAGTLVGVLLAAGLGSTAGTGSALFLLATVVLIVAGIPICAQAGERLQRHDHPAIVWDEIASFPLVLIGLPLTAPWLLAGFVVFRVFDVLKPWPIRWLDRRLGGGIGVMADDVAAALAACAVLHVFRVIM